MMKQIRTFDTGATRDTDINKPNYIKALSPIVLREYVDYLGKHRIQSDGNLRDWDNWKQGMPLDVCLEGEDRHHRAVWLLHQGFPAFDNHGPVTLKDSLCGVIFNAMGYLHEILIEEQKEKFIYPSDWKIEDNDAGWYVCKMNEFLHKDFTLHKSVTGWDHHEHGEAPGYWSTKEAAENALKQYLGKQR